MGNVPLSLHEWEVDFAAWCSYKYLNAGPGAIGGLFVHNRHDRSSDLTILRGWWGHQVSTRFLMNNRTIKGPEWWWSWEGEHSLLTLLYLVLEFVTIEGARGFQLSNPDVLSMTCLLGGLRIFAQTDMMAVRSKSLRMTSYLRRLLKPLLEANLIRIITPVEPAASGAQLSLLITHDQSYGGLTVDEIVTKCKAKGVVLDKREPNMLRVAPIALYNTFADVYLAAKVLISVIKQARV